jgi:serine/threonine protein kinase
MADLSAEKLAQRAFDLGLVDERQLDVMRSDLGPLEGNTEDFRRVASRRELLTNYQIDRLLKGERTGFFYGDYKVLYLIGTGTFARVYRAENRKNRKVYAVKVLRKARRDDPKEVELFLREGEVGLLLRHPNIVAVYEVNSDPRAPYFVMDFVEGQNLREFVRMRKTLPPLDATRIMCDVLSGLAYAAQQGIFHRDLKLSNILLNSRGVSRLVDFGLYGTRTSDTTSQDVPSARSIDYVALERGSGVRRNDPRSDIFFAGVMFYHMLAGKSPLSDAQDRLQRLNVSRYRDVAPLVEVAPHVPRAICQVVSKAMLMDADKRYQNPQEMFLELQSIKNRMEQGDTNPGAPAPETVKPVDLPSAAVEDDHPDETLVQPPPLAAIPANLPRGTEQEGLNHSVLVVESNVEMQNLLRSKLKKHGYRVLIFSDPQRVIERFRDDDKPPAEVVMFCCGHLGEASLEAFNTFGDLEQTRKVPAIILVDDDQQQLASQAQLGAQRVLLTMPIKVRDVRNALKQLLNIR